MPRNAGFGWAVLALKESTNPFSNTVQRQPVCSEYLNSCRSCYTANLRRRSRKRSSQTAVVPEEETVVDSFYIVHHFISRPGEDRAIALSLTTALPSRLWGRLCHFSV